MPNVLDSQPLQSETDLGLLSRENIWPCDADGHDPTQKSHDVSQSRQLGGSATMYRTATATTYYRNGGHYEPERKRQGNDDSCRYEARSVIAPRTRLFTIDGTVWVRKCQRLGHAAPPYRRSKRPIQTHLPIGGWSPASRTYIPAHELFGAQESGWRVKSPKWTRSSRGRDV